MFLRTILLGGREMLRIFGYYGFGNCRKSLISRIEKAFKVKGMFNKYIVFNQRNIFLNYEMAKTDEAKNFYFVDKNKQIACFIVGNIYAYEGSPLEILAGRNIAKIVAQKYKVGGLGFIKKLRGVFNIILIDKKQVFLINDHLGFSPMYIYQTDLGILFCNEPEPIIWLNEKNRIDYTSTAEFLVYGFVPDGKTFISGLANQVPGTILKFRDKEISTKKYADFKPTNISGMPEREKIKSVGDVFRESVQIRSHGNNENVFLELSGGWDTRFILANLISLNKKVFACTDAIRREDLAIAKKIIRKMNLAHYIREKFIDADSDERLFYDLTFLRRQTAKMAVKYKQAFPGKFKDLIGLKYFTLPRFTGLFGTEVLGFVPFWFTRTIKKDLLADGSRVFKKEFLFKALKNKGGKKFTMQTSGQPNAIYDFVSQVSRTYLSAYPSQSWARPTKFFSYQFLHPFIDSKFVRLICAFESKKHMPYKLYEKVFKRHFPSYLKIPWTHQYMRRRNDMNTKAPDKSDGMPPDRMIYRDKEFISFLKKSPIHKTDKAIGGNLKELYFLFHWFKIYQSVLDPSDVRFFTGDTLNQ